MDADGREQDVMRVELLLGVPWVVGVPVAQEAAPAGDPEPLSLAEPEAQGSLRAFRVVTGMSLVGCVATMALMASGAVFRSSELAFAMIVADLVCMALAVVAWPRPVDDDDGEVFWTLGREPAVVGQCSPSRVTLTGGER